MATISLAMACYDVLMWYGRVVYGTVRHRLIWHTMGRPSAFYTGYILTSLEIYTVSHKPYAETPCSF